MHPKKPSKKELSIAITYSVNGTVAGYRDGVPLGKPYQINLVTYDTGKSEIVFGLRHGTGAGGNRMFEGTVTKARSVTVH